MFKNNLTLAYILLVGVPLLILAGTLRAGRNLTAEPAVFGEWMVERTPNSTPIGKCTALFAETGQTTLVVDQTGTTVSISFGDPRKTTFSGTLKNGRIAAQGECGGTESIRLEADVTGKPGQRSLQGRLWVEGCDSCAPVAFRASRLAQARK